jgi:hypothetical protein
MSRSLAVAVPEPLLAATIRWGSVGALLLTALAIMGSPGPVTISLTAAGSAYGMRRSLGYLLGSIVGTAIVLVAVATGITATLPGGAGHAARPDRDLGGVHPLAPMLRDPHRARIVNTALAAALVGASALAVLR